MSDWELIPAGILLLCASMYFGTGWSLALFTLPNAPRWTVATYHDQIVGPIQRATLLFTGLTTVMIVAAVALLVGEWGSSYVLWPAIVLAAVAGATLLTTLALFPYNRRLRAGIRDEAELRQVLRSWISWNWLRLALWSAQWAAIATWFALKAR